ncbi:MAG: 23S rRNA (uracil(1939)-C(5))-methyltransferase RlmD [Myxococcota bacterium]
MQQVQKNLAKPPCPGQEHTLHIEKLAFGGLGIAYLQGKTVFVPGSLPGQQVLAVITRAKDNCLHARVREVYKKAPKQIQAPCVHFGACGGCVWQQLPYNEQLQHKQQLICETLQHLTPANKPLRQQLGQCVRNILPSPQVFHYRNKLEMSFGYAHMHRQRTPDGKLVWHDEQPSIGFHQRGQWATVLPIAHCHLYEENCHTLLEQVHTMMRTSGLSVYNPKTHKGVWRNLLLRRGVQTGEQMIALVVQAAGKQLQQVLQHAQQLGRTLQPTCLLVIENNAMNDRPLNAPVHPVLGEPFITERLCNLTYRISPFSFFQTNTLGAQVLYEVVREAAQLQQHDVLLDAYCGMGTIGQHLAPHCKQVIGIENNPTAIADAKQSAAANGIANMDFYLGNVEEVLANTDAADVRKFDVAVVDPPRAGLHPKAAEALVQLAPKRLVYVSCNTTTFARDLAAFLQEGYQLQWVQGVDMFPHTAHIETVAALRRF